MDTITHTLFGLGLYGAVNKRDMDKNTKRAYLLTAVGASQIPDIDVISRLWDTEGLYQMWHRALPIQFFLLRFGLCCFFCYPSCSSKLRIRSFSCWVGLQFSYIIQVIYSMRGERDTWSHFQI